MKADQQARVQSMLVFACLALMAQDLQAETYTGLSLEQGISRLESDEFRIYYSSDLVKPWMLIESEPAAADHHELLLELLAPHGLVTASAPHNAVLIVRAEATLREEASSTIVQPEPAAIPLLIQQPPLEEVIVSTSRYPLKGSGNARFVLDAATVGRLPNIADDSLRPVARLPGATSNGLSAQSHVRGGELDETLVRFDGLRLFDPFHLKDFQSVFSAVDSRFIETTEVYTGGYPVAFGDRMSGVVDLSSIQAPRTMQHEVGISFFSSSVFSTGPVADGRGHWIFSTRRSNLDLLYKNFSDLPERPRYRDTFARFAFDISDHVSISGNLMQSTDDIALSDDIDREERAEAEHSDSYRWLTLTHNLENGITGRTLLADTRLGSQRIGSSEKSGVSSGTLSDRRDFTIRSLQTDWSWPLSENWWLELGGYLSWSDGTYRYIDDATYDLLFDVEGASPSVTRTHDLSVEADGEQSSLYGAARRRITDRLTLGIGLRWDRQTLTADTNNTLSPRIGLRLQLTDATELRASVGRFSQSQAINELQINDGVTTFFEPQRSNHRVIGLHHRIRPGLNLRIETYEKEMSRLKPRFENLLNPRVLLPELKPDRIEIRPDSATARGVEFLLEASGRNGPDWWVSYGWSEVLDYVGGQTVRRSWDQPHSFSGGLALSIGHWDVGLTSSYRSGWPTTSVALAPGSSSVPIVEAQDLNGIRRDHAFSVDAKLARQFLLERSTVKLTLQLTNLLDRSNPCCTEYEIGDEEEAGLFVLKELAYLPIVPSIGVLWQF